MHIPLLFPACPICKELGYQRGLCGFCSEKLWQRREPVIREQSNYVIRSLFSWRRGEWPGLGWWLKSLKKKEHPAYWREAALWAEQLFPVNLRGPIAFVPIPSLGPNHASGFARELVRWRGGEVVSALKPPPPEKQKQLHWEERWLRRFEPLESASQLCSNYNSVVIVDDVVTTGATAEAAVQALGRPERCEVWTLADRRPCGPRAALL